MTSGQKTAVSLLITVLIFALFVTVAFAGVFSFIETRFYQPSAVKVAKLQLSEISATLEEYLSVHMQRFSSFAALPSVKRCVLPNQTDEDIQERENISGTLLSETAGLLGIRLADSNGRRIHYSTFQTDLLKRTAGSVNYTNYTNLDELPYETVAKQDGDVPSVFFDSTHSRLVYSIPFYDNYDTCRGTMLFYVAAADYSRFLADKHAIKISDTATLIAPAAENETEPEPPHGFVLGLPQTGSSLLAEEIGKRWQAGLFGTERILETGSGTWILISDNSSPAGIIAHVYPESLFLFSDNAKILLLICVFITLYLTVFLLFNLKQDNLALIRARIKTFQFSVINEYLEKKEAYNWNEIARNIEMRKNDATKELKKSLGRKAKKYQSTVDDLIDKSWTEIIAAIGKKSDQEPPHSDSLRAEDIRKMLEEIIASTPVMLSAQAQTGTPHSAPVSAARPVAAAQPEKAAPAAEAPVKPAIPEDMEEIQELEDPDDAEEPEEIQELENLADAEEPEEIQELEDPADAEEPEEIQELEDLADAEEPEEIQELEDLADAEEPEEIQELEDLADAEEPEEIQELEDPADAEEPEEIQELEDPADAEEPEEIQETEDPANAEEPEEIQETEDPANAEEPEEIQELEDPADAEEPEEIQEPEDLAVAEEPEEIQELEDPADAEEPEEIQELEDLADTEESEQFTYVSTEEFQVEQEQATVAALQEPIQFGEIKTETDDTEIPTVVFTIYTPDFSMLDEPDALPTLDDIPKSTEDAELVSALDDSAPFCFAMQFEADKVTELEPVHDQNPAIIEQNGIYVIQNAVSAAPVDQNFKQLVDSVLK